MFAKRILNFYSIVIGIIFIISGAGKVIDTTGFSNLIYQYGFKYLMILSPLIVITEVLLGLLLILLINPKRYSFFSFILLIVFTLAFTYAHFKNGINDCGCFGTLQPSNIPPFITFIRNLILLIMSFIVWRKYPESNFRQHAKWKKYVIITLMSLAIFISGFTFKIPAFFQNNSGEHRYLNQHIINTEFSNYIQTEIGNSYLIFCFTYKCPHCWNSIGNLHQFIKSSTIDSVIVFGSGEPDDENYFHQNFHPDFAITDLPAETMSEIVDFVPTAFYVKNDTIKVIIQSELPSPVTFNEYYLPPLK